MADQKATWRVHKHQLQYEYLAWHREHDVLNGACRRPGCDGRCASGTDPRALTATPAERTEAA